MAISDANTSISEAVNSSYLKVCIGNYILVQIVGNFSTNQKRADNTENRSIGTTGITYPVSTILISV